MNKKKKPFRFMCILALGVIPFMSGCSQSEKPKEEEKLVNMEEAPKKVERETFNESQVQAELAIGVKGAENFYDQKMLAAKKGQVVRLTFTNNAPTGGMAHNWVLVNPGTAERVAQKSIAAGAGKGWVAKEDENVLAFTRMVDPQGKDSVVFRVPQEAGEYPFICTYPGHFQTMRGVLKVE